MDCARQELRIRCSICLTLNAHKMLLSYFLTSKLWLQHCFWVRAPKLFFYHCTSWIRHVLDDCNIRGFNDGFTPAIIEGGWGGVGWDDHRSKLTHLNTRDRNAPSVSIHRNIGRCLRRSLTCGRSNNLFALVNDPLHILFCTAVNIAVTAVEPVIWLKDVQLLS